MPVANRLRELIDNPGSYSGTPGFQFALDQGLGAAQRSSSRMRGSGGVMAELTRLGTGYAQQDYGNEVDRLGRINANDQQFQLGQEQNRNAANRNANDFTLGTQTNANNRQRNLFDFALGSESNANNADRNWWDYQLGSERNATDNFSARDQAASRRRRDALDFWNSFGRGA